MSKPKKCPQCGSEKVLNILYGLPTEEAAIDPNIYLGGCCIEEGHEYLWHCKKCRWEWGREKEGQYKPAIKEENE